MALPRTAWLAHLIHRMAGIREWRWYKYLKLQAPSPDRLIRHRDATRRQHLLDHPQAQREPKIQPDRIADQLSGIAIASIERISARRHPGWISDHLGSAKPGATQLDGAIRCLPWGRAAPETRVMTQCRSREGPARGRFAKLPVSRSMLRLSTLWRRRVLG
jgi:hypothetical protein